MNQYFLLDIPRGKAYQQHLPAMMKLLRILYPAQDETSLWNNPRTCDELNDAIDNYLKRRLKRNTADLCLIEYVKLFSDGELNIQNLNFKQSVAVIVANERILRKHIEEQYGYSATQKQEKAAKDKNNGCSVLGLLLSILEWFKKLFLSILEWFKKRFLSILEWFKKPFLSILEWFKKRFLSILEWFKKPFGSDENEDSSFKSNRANSNIPLTKKEAYEILELLKATYEVNKFV